MNNPAQASLNLERIYIKDASYEAPNTPIAFMEQKAPAINVGLDVSHQLVDEEGGYFEVILGVTVKAENEDKKSVFLVELQQAGIFQLQNIPDNEKNQVLEIACANILLPFAREAINDYVCKGGFPQLLINPINFEAMYQQRHGSKDEKLQH